MIYSYTLCDSVERINLEDWNQLRRPEGDPFMDPRFVATVERSMSRQGKYWVLIIYDAQKRPVATACLSLMRIDGAVLANRLVKRLVHGVRRLWHRFLYLNVLMVGLPVSGGQSQLRIRPDADPHELLNVLDAVLRKLAVRHRAAMIVWKEFDAEQIRLLDGLQDYGYFPAHSLPMNHFHPRFADFDEYCAALTSNRRYDIRRSVRKFERSGLRMVRVTGSQNADVLYTDEVHRLYESVLAHAKSKFENLSAEFFRELARQFRDQAVFFFVYQGQRIVACGASLLTEAVCHMLFVGLDYEVNRQADVYFNLFYRRLDYGMQQGVSDIWAGQTADTFKSRLGCYQTPRYLYLKGRGWWAPIVRIFSGLYFPHVKLTPRQLVLREERARKPK